MSKKPHALFESLYTQYHPMVLHLCVGFMQGDKALAHDHFAGSFYQCLECAGQIQGECFL